MLLKINTQFKPIEKTRHDIQETKLNVSWLFIKINGGQKIVGKVLKENQLNKTKTLIHIHQQLSFKTEMG